MYVSRGGSGNKRKGGPENFILRENLQDCMQKQFDNILFPFKRGPRPHRPTPKSTPGELSLWLVISSASMVFLQVLQFSSIRKKPGVCREYLTVVRNVHGVKAGPHQLLAVIN
jgi:hypothetical protein